MVSRSYSTYRTPPIDQTTRQGYNPRPKTPLSAPRWETLPETRSPSYSVPPPASTRHPKRFVNEVDGEDEVDESSNNWRYGRGRGRGNRPNRPPSNRPPPRTQEGQRYTQNQLPTPPSYASEVRRSCYDAGRGVTPRNWHTTYPEYRSPSLSVPSPIWKKMQGNRPFDGVECEDNDELETLNGGYAIAGPSNRRPYGQGRGGRRNYPSTGTHRRLPTPHSEYQETRMSSFPTSSRRGGTGPGSNHFNNGYSPPPSPKRNGKQKAVMQDDQAPMMYESEPLAEETETQASSDVPRTSRVSSSKGDTQINPSGSGLNSASTSMTSVAPLTSRTALAPDRDDNSDERRNAPQDNLFYEEDPNWVHDLAVELGLSEGSEHVLQNVALEPDDRKTLFLVALILNKRSVDIPSKAKEQFNAIALKLLLNFSGSSLFKDRFLNTFRFSVYIAPRLDRMGLDVSWMRDVGKMRALDVQWQKNFGEARRQIIEAIIVSITNELPISGLAKSLRKKRPNNDELNMFALMRQTFQNGGRKGFFDRVDDKLKAMHGMSMKEYKKEFKRFRRKDERQFPVPETPNEEENGGVLRPAPSFQPPPLFNFPLDHILLNNSL
ncbi:uncharacterized protein FOMMEDRAFT_162510 [Fomitiporia mediterranea MF3/22]|uniref:uncharacterized protein n=1 Tax=Fomitiporia mediterranea (strain MF3/22) TaxID=694068 RepID=UPI0004409B0F|nr:uncharacterized protein FOMMEDRAFT_162510 [Fomitiporia mediterranea MF3/22]EJC98152.1 hypothetical protein FOMMEDRAFT_162510 [Fomitiporia mediterranea MF3/22]